ncbi:hypothetical protein K1T71_006732 [Dendrolimus kikuchii]|uniref:Uncharacterized protein n=1 Tax=Dendrolimus kikuchii TaxID=765133 RepID=A0ACC1D1M3_9NEOP|nr:hypothetical protein K1T71_006732 [Dendrolimus kikuchii]
MILEYVLRFHLPDCLNILAEKDTLGYYSIKIDFLKLFETYPDVGDKVLCEPVQSLPICDKEIVKAQQNILETEEYKLAVSSLEYYYLKKNVHARFFGLPVCPELHRTVFPKNVDLGCFLKVTGTVVRVTQSKMLEYQRKYICMKCKYESIIEAEFEHRYILKAPIKCGNTETRCRCSMFTQVNLVSREHCKDYQEIKIQEQVNKLSIGTIPGSMWVVLEDDLVDCCKPGDDVVICGTVRRRWRPSALSKKCEVELVLQANYIEVCNAQRSEVIATAPDIKECFDEYWMKYEGCPLKGRDHILKSVSPQVYGLHLVKLAVLLTVITGSNHVVEEDDKRTSSDDKHATRVRGQCHLLLVGDPGTGKSQLLRAGADLTARSVFTSGAGSTRAGLTCAALREEGEWQLEAGALVLSDGGVCCIDEISQLREHDRTAIHEAMEQQTISIAKAGIVCKLNTRCAIIAACNPKGHYDTDQPLSVNVSLGTPLLSRFDLIFIMLDSKNKAWDKLVSSYILFGESNCVKNLWNIEKLQMYISLVGPRNTVMTKSANVILQSYYMTQRKSEHRDPSRTTVRMLDSLVRLSQAHCRLMYRTTILPMDAIIAVSLVDLSMQDCTLDDTVDALHSTFQKYPDFDYLCTAYKLLSLLNLYEIWHNELLYYAKLLQVDHKTLENDIERGINKLFAKFDDVTDDNIQLSATLVTSSYFNGKRDKNNDLGFITDLESHTEGKNGHTHKTVVNEKLAVTLKKHAMLNKEVKNPNVVIKKVSNKRKRKQASVDSSTIKNKINKKPKKPKAQNSSDLSSSEENDEISMLNAVPSVYDDVFSDLDLDFKFDDRKKDKKHKSIGIKKTTKIKDNNISREYNVTNIEKLDREIHQFDNAKNTELKITVKSHQSNGENNDVMLNLPEENYADKHVDFIPQSTKVSENDGSILEKPKVKTIDKLKQFQFVEKHDLSKYEQRITKPKGKHDVVKLEDIKIEQSLQLQNKSSSSQISMFESDDCDIDLDI